MRAVILLITLLIAFASPACAADDVAASRDIIRAQEQAITRDDAAKAYSYASPVLQAVFGAPDVFMQMVRKNYAPVYRHKSFQFGEAKASDGNIAQIVDIIDAEGAEWEALYTLEKQQNGSLKITGCSLKKVTTA